MTNLPNPVIQNSGSVDGVQVTIPTRPHSEADSILGPAMNLVLSATPVLVHMNYNADSHADE
jgi:hypothetical protein